MHKLDSSRDGHKDDLDRLTELVNKMVAQMNQPQQPRPCGVSGDPTHPNDKCPLIQEDVADLSAMDYGPCRNFGNNVYNQDNNSNYQSGFNGRGQQQ